jgi:AraC-like DNA-binding protein
MKRDDLMRRMHRAGLRLDDAATAARIAENALVNERNQLIARASGVGMSVRAIARLFGLSKTHVARVSLDMRGHGTAATATVQTPKQGMNP